VALAHFIFQEFRPVKTPNRRIGARSAMAMRACQSFQRLMTCAADRDGKDHRNAEVDVHSCFTEGLARHGVAGATADLSQLTRSHK
jgi:hypothetical protein